MRGVESGPNIGIRPQGLAVKHAADGLRRERLRGDREDCPSVLRDQALIAARTRRRLGLGHQCFAAGQIVDRRTAVGEADGQNRIARSSMREATIDRSGMTVIPPVAALTKRTSSGCTDPSPFRSDQVKSS